MHADWMRALVALGVASSCAPFDASPNADAGARMTDPSSSDAGSPDGATAGSCPLGCPVAAWTFEEDAGAVVDRSLHGHDGLLDGVVRVDANGSRAASFDGVDGHLMFVEPSPALEIVGPLTIVFWIRIDDTKTDGQDHVVLSKPWVANSMTAPLFYHYGIEFDANGTKDLQLFLGAPGTMQPNVFSIHPKLGQFVHVAFVYDGKLVRGYLDGQQAAQAPLAIKMEVRSTELRLGCDGKEKQVFKGQLDDVRIYDRALSADEVETIHQRRL